MARFEDEDMPVRAAREPLHERVAVLEKIRREHEEQIEELRNRLDSLSSAVARELGF